jgi:D-threonate/D-erythronate kinase
MVARAMAEQAMAAPPRVVIVADDLTGAMDVAGPLAMCGLHTCAVASVGACTARHLAGAEVVSINAESRHLSTAAAADRVRAIVRDLVHPGTEILLKKIDSTLRGNVVAETMAMLEASGRTAAVLAPAFPAQGRTLQHGVVHVRGVPLGDTGFARDALSPPPREPLDVLFARAAPDVAVRLVERGATFALRDTNAREILVVDTLTDEDLRSTVRALRGRLRHVVLVGSAGIAEALAETCFAEDRSAPAAPALDGPLLFVVGSRAEQSAQQVAALGEAGAQIVPAPNGGVDVEAAARSQVKTLVITAVPDGQGRTTDAASVASRLARGIADLLERRRFAGLVVTGGDTALAILERLSQPVLRVMGNVLPGIPFSRIHATGGDLWFVTKAGGFGAPETFVAVAQRLRAGTEPSERIAVPKL